MNQIGIIGGGPSGLALAHDLSNAGHQVTVFEERSELGGLARSFKLGDIRIDRYYHFLCGNDNGYLCKLSELGIETKVRWKPTKMGFFYRGKLYPFSSSSDLLRFDGISLAGRLRYGAFVLYCWLTRHWQHLDRMSAEKWLQGFLGNNTYRATWYPLLRIKFNHYHAQVSAAWAWHRVHRVAQSRKTPLHPEMLGYLQGGTYTLIEALATELWKRGAKLLLDQPVHRILVDDNRVTGIETRDGRLWPFDYVVSTVPLPTFLRITPHLPADYRSRLAAIDFVGVVCLVLRLRQPLTDNYWLNVNDPRIPFNGCIEYTNLDENATPDHSSIVYVPYYLPTGHERFSYTDEELLQESVDALQIINRDFDADWITDFAVSRDTLAQAICQVGFLSQVPAHETPIRNLYLLESTQLYPSDRSISGTIDLAQKVSFLITKADHSRRPQAVSMPAFSIG